MSPLYNYIKNQVLLGEFKEEELTILVSRGHITEAEKTQLVGMIPPAQ